MKFDPLSSELTTQQILYVKKGQLHIENISNKVRLFFRRVFLRNQYSQNKVFALFRSRYESVPHKSFHQLELIKRNYKLLINQTGKSKKCSIFNWLLYGYSKPPTAIINYYTKTVKQDLKIKIKEFDDEKLFLKRELEPLIKYFRFIAQNYLPSTRNSSYKIASQNLLHVLTKISIDLSTLSDGKLNRIVKQCETLIRTLERFYKQEDAPNNLTELLSKLQNTIVAVKIQLECLNFKTEFNEVLDEDGDATIFEAFTAYGELNIMYLSDFINKLNSSLSPSKKIQDIQDNSVKTFEAVLKAISLFYIKDYIAKNIFSADDFEMYLKKNADQICVIIKNMNYSSKAS